MTQISITNKLCSEKMEALMCKIENISEVLVQLFLARFSLKPRFDDDDDGGRNRPTEKNAKQCKDNAMLRTRRERKETPVPNDV